MNFVDLCEQLAEKFGTASVYFAEYPGLGVRRPEFAEFVLRKGEALYEVGGVERGEWRSVAKFRSETEACEYILEKLQRTAPKGNDTVEGTGRSSSVNEMFDREFRKQFGRGSTS